MDCFYNMINELTVVVLINQDDDKMLDVNNAMVRQHSSNHQNQMDIETVISK